MTNQIQKPRWIILKFGGTSVASGERWRVIRGIVAERIAAGYRVLVVHSAVSGVSNRLERLVKQPDPHLLEEIITIHRDLLSSLGLEQNLLAANFVRLGELRLRAEEEGDSSAYLVADIMAQGELMATTASAEYLKRSDLEITWIDARTLLHSRSDDRRNLRSRVLSARCDSRPDRALTESLDPEQALFLTQGFIAADQAGRTVVLGRGGSDTSAAYFGALLNAARVEIWTDVPGMFTANPRMISTARQLRELDYEEAQEIATSGGKVLHPRSIQPLADVGIPMHVYALTEPHAGGTVISSQPRDRIPQVKAISIRKGIVLISMESMGMWHQAGFLADAFEAFKAHGFSVDLISTSQTNVTVSLDPAENLFDEQQMAALEDDLARICRVEKIENCGAVTLVGHRIRANLHKLGPAMQVFAEHRVHMLNQSSNDLNLTVVVDEDQTERLAKNLHRLLIGLAHEEQALGPTWEELSGVMVKAPERGEPWWSQQTEKVLEFAAGSTPCYLYDRATIGASIEALKKVRSVDRLYYAVKANPFPGVLQIMHAQGLGFECVSPGEVAHVLCLFPELDRQQIIFTPNFAGREEYAEAFALGVQVTVDNPYPLTNWPELFAGRKILLRLDPGHGHGHHKYVRTAGEQSKFGIELRELDALAPRLASLGVTVVGLHSHSGSGITLYENWQNIAEFQLQALAHFPDCRVLNLGGGLGIQETPSEPRLNLELLDRGLSALKEQTECAFWLEPGRFLVAQSGALLTRVTQVKRKGTTRYVGVETGMNSLIRPALYGAYHDIVNLTRLDEAPSQNVTVVGPICETGDILGVDRHLPECREGDTILIANAGAYGAAMASNYNLRKPAIELMYS